MARRFSRSILLLGAAAGAATAYLLDPERGAERRAMARERLDSALGRGAGSLGAGPGGGGPALDTEEATVGGTSAAEAPQWDAPAVVDGGPAAEDPASARPEGSAGLEPGDGPDRSPLPPTPGA